MSRNSFTEQDLKNKGLVEISPGIWERPIIIKDSLTVTNAETFHDQTFETSDITKNDLVAAAVQQGDIKVSDAIKILARPLTDAECIKILDEGGSLEESCPFNKCVQALHDTPKEILDRVNQNGIMFIDTSDVSQEYIINNFWHGIKEYLKAHTFNIVPNTKPRQTISDKWNKRKCVMKYRAFADALRSQASMLNVQLKSPLIVEFHVPMAKSWGKAKRIEMEGKPHEQTPDCDNFCKALQDALLGQDNLISEIHARKLWSTNGQIIIYQ